MPRRISRVQKRKPVPKNRRKQSKRRRNSAHPIGDLVARSVTTLLGYVPGAAYLKEIASFAFKQFGWVPQPRLNYLPEYYTEVNWIGMSCRFALNYVLLAVNSHYGITQNEMENNRKSFLSQFEDCRLIDLAITIIPTCELRSRQGMLAAVFVPFQSDTDEANTNALTPSFMDVTGTLGAKQGPATRSLTLTFKPSSPWIRDYHRMNMSFGVFQAAYYDPQRNNATAQFPVSEFNAEIKISGKIQFRKPLLAGGYAQFSTEVKPFIRYERVDSRDRIYSLRDDHSIASACSHSEYRSRHLVDSVLRWGNPILDGLDSMIHE